jgi:hypothetical protein
MPLDKAAARHRIQHFDFPGLFTQELGWDWHKPTLPVSLAGRNFTIQAVAEKRGFVVWHCPPAKGEKLPDSALRRRIEREITKAAHEHLVIFTDAAQTMQVWQWVRREPGKPLRVRETLWTKGQTGEILIQKLDPLFVSLDDEETLTLVDVTGRAAGNVDERVTKRFYEEFRKQHAAFLKFITGIPNQGDHEWYASVLLNRLMFLYFVQKKGFLDGDTNYLRNRLRKLRTEHGSDKFYSFYRYFLLRLFHEGLGTKERKAELEKLVGRVPYLNGGIFDVHKLERPKKDEGYGDDIQIPDKAFEAIFNYFDNYQWHLDERPLRADNEINPDVLGYIFEKYINQKQMGAYYTKEDITEYIGKNTILPFLFDAVQGKVKAAFEGDASVWSYLKADPDRYIYPAVRHGLSWDYQASHPELGEPLAKEQPLPADIAAGLDTTKPNLLERRKSWNKPAPAEFGLPTEIWRETVARRQRCAEVRKKLAAGEVRNVADFITLNLDLRRFAQDVIARCDSAELLAAIWHTLAGKTPAAKSTKKLQPPLTILDPTCGSGAFLFAALNLLEPLYEGCLDRMEGLLADARAAGTKIHPESHLAEFQLILQQVERHPNERYFIFKTIILHNLYGVDLMEEAVEICKLRLFLKLAAQVDPDTNDANLGIEPLPDIDFNIRAGNTLVGYATRAELEAVAEKDLLLKEEVKTVLEAAENAAAAFETFVRSQVEGENPAEFKRLLSERLKTARDQCDRFLAESYRMGITKKPRDFADWKRSHQPFHWFVEFFGILNCGGFDAIIGNPPYVVNTPEKVDYSIRENLFSTYPTKNLYAFVCERSLQLGRPTAAIGMIVQLTALSAEKMSPLQNLLLPRGLLVTPAFPRRPESIFDGVEMPVTILLSLHGSPHLYTTRVNRFYTEERPSALAAMALSSHSIRLHGHRIAKIGSQLEIGIYGKVHAQKARLGSLVAPGSKHVLYYQEACRYWVKACVGLPFFRRNGERMSPPHGRTLGFRDSTACAFAGCLVNSTLFYWFYSAFSDCEHINDALIRDFRIPTLSSADDWQDLQSRLAASQKTNARRKTINTKQGHKIEYDEMDAPGSKPIFDEIDAALAAHYGFTKEEQDFIVNYDLKYRLGRGSEAEED